ncbi:hypothetical protein HMPREF0083_03720 [Aneurinibacillus aneurinilyticus ATCC 12856]|uniref:Uncharacterized protein n=1 Tax=Aneurinibacillus aneurinilyticus ATCC 12856 TaxID=649747 RepID=U1WI35_ANEAE|nr:hypothetical protein HMPREF0083_03720 [Aneurinibacillus aneurinilyticus ATCC 12856]
MEWSSSFYRMTKKMSIQSFLKPRVREVNLFYGLTHGSDGCIL